MAELNPPEVCSVYTVSTDVDTFNLPVLHTYLARQSHWAQGIPSSSARFGTRCVLAPLWRNRIAAGFRSDLRVSFPIAPPSLICAMFSPCHPGVGKASRVR